MGLIVSQNDRKFSEMMPVWSGVSCCCIRACVPEVLTAAWQMASYTAPNGIGSYSFPIISEIEAAMQAVESRRQHYDCYDWIDRDWHDNAPDGEDFRLETNFLCNKHTHTHTSPAWQRRPHVCRQETNRTINQCASPTRQCNTGRPLERFLEPFFYQIRRGEGVTGSTFTPNFTVVALTKSSDADKPRDAGL